MFRESKLHWEIGTIEFEDCRFLDHTIHCHSLDMHSGEVDALFEILVHLCARRYDPRWRSVNKNALAGCAMADSHDCRS